MPGPIIKGITLTKWLHAPGGRKALNMRPLLIHKGLCCFSKLKFRRSFLVNQAAINIAKFSKTTALKRTNFSFNILSQLQFQNHNQTGLSNLLVLWSIFRKKFLLPFAYRSYIRLFVKNILMAPFWKQTEKRGPFTLLF